MSDRPATQPLGGAVPTPPRGSVTAIVNESAHQLLSSRLDGDWLAAVATERGRRRVADLDLDTSDWVPTSVPGHWRDSEGLADADAVLYRHRFSMEPVPTGRRRWLSIDGLCYQGDVWLDGAYVGDTEGYFVQHVFDISDKRDTDHVLAIEATCAEVGDPDQKRNVTGTLQDSNHLDLSKNPGGLWRDVRIEETGMVRIDVLRVLVLEAEADRAILRITAEFDVSGNHQAVIRTLVDKSSNSPGTGLAAMIEQEHVLARGRNTLAWHLAVERPDLWWPHSLGDQPLYDVRVEVEVAGEISHVRKRRTGMRTIETRRWVSSINGERLFLKGTNLAPTNLDRAAATSSDHRLVLALARDAGLDLVRIHGHIASPELYREADQLGLLIWQDFPLQWGHSRSIKRAAERQAIAAVNQLGHHPSIVMWTGHNEPGAAEQRRDSNRSRRDPKALLKRRTREQLPSWNRTILDRTVKRAFETSDPSRPVNAHSGVAPHPPQLDGTDSHLWFGWRHGVVGDLDVEARRIGRRLRFVSEFGAQSLPHDEQLEALISAATYPALDDDALLEAGASLERLERHSPRANHDTYASWVDATQTYQAWLTRRTIETLRRLKYRPTGGYCHFFLSDSSLRVSEAALDHQRRPKQAWRALVAASRPVIVVANLAERELSRGSTKTTLHVVSDLREAVEDARVTTRWLVNGVVHNERTFTGDFAADSVTALASIELETPVGPGEAVLELSLIGANSAGQSIAANNRYRYSLAEPESPNVESEQTE